MNTETASAPYDRTPTLDRKASSTPASGETTNPRLAADREDNVAPARAMKRPIDGPHKITAPEERLMACAAIARRAQSAFTAACQTTFPDEADLNLHAAVDKLSQLWDYSDLRGRGFQDLVGLLEAAIADRDISQFDSAKQDVIRSAFADLARPFIDEDDVVVHRKGFARANVDILRPLTQQTKKKVRITIEDAE